MVHARAEDLQSSLAGQRDVAADGPAARIIRVTVPRPERTQPVPVTRLTNVGAVVTAPSPCRNRWNPGTRSMVSLLAHVGGCEDPTTVREAHVFPEASLSAEKNYRSRS